jgi:hypothetical protein
MADSRLQRSNIHVTITALMSLKIPVNSNHENSEETPKGAQNEYAIWILLKAGRKLS